MITWCQECEENAVQGRPGDTYRVLCLPCAYPYENWVYDAICYGVREYKV